MPKVSDEYKKEVRKRILLAAEIACEEKPAYLLTMRDVIRTAGLSPGAVYSYYPDIDSLWFDYMNTIPDVLAEKNIHIRPRRLPAEPADDYIDRCLGYVSRIEDHISANEAKIYYELEIKRAADPEFARKRREETRVSETYKLILSDLAEAVTEGTDVSAGEIYIFIKSFLEGLAKNVVEKRCYGIAGRDMNIGTQVDFLKNALRRMRDV